MEVKLCRREANREPLNQLPGERSTLVLSNLPDNVFGAEAETVIKGEQSRNHMFDISIYVRKEKKPSGRALCK